MTRLRRSLVAAASALLCLAAAAPASHAGVLVADAPKCDAKEPGQVFLPWVDPMNYVPAPGGTAESKAGWSSLRGASIQPGNQPYPLNGVRLGESSLRMPGGAVATTDVMCVGIEYPTLRLVTKADSGLLSLSVLTVEVDFEDRSGRVRTLPVGVITPNRTWSLSLPFPIAASLLPLLPGERTPVRFRLRAVGPAIWSVDDFYVDPYRTR